MRLWSWISVVLLVIHTGSVVWSQAVSTESVGTPWEKVEQQRDAIEKTILSGDVGGGFVLSASHLYEWKDTPAFFDITTSVFRAYGGLPVPEEERLLNFLKGELTTTSLGVGWMECGILAMAAMKPEEAVVSFRKASQDTVCCKAPLTYALLGQALTCTEQINEATKAFETAIKAASLEAVVQFQMRYLYAKAMFEQGREHEWLKVLAECCESRYPFERVWGLQQEAQNAWRKRDRVGFINLTNLAVAQMETDGASPEWKWHWEKDCLGRANRFLGYAQAVIKGSSDAQMALDYEAAIFDYNRGDLKAALSWFEKWPPLFDMKEIDQWDETRQLWVQRIYVAYYHTLARMGRVDEGVAGLEAMIPDIRDNPQEMFSTDIYCYLGYALMQGGREREAKAAFEIGLSILDVPGEVIDPELAYHPRGRIGRKMRESFVANYRDLVNYFNQLEGEQ